MEAIKITWRRLRDGTGYEALGYTWVVEPLGPRSWAIYHNGVQVRPVPTDRTADGKPRKRRQAAARFWRTSGAAFAAAEAMIRKEGRGAR